MANPLPVDTHDVLLWENPPGGRTQQGDTLPPGWVWTCSCKGGDHTGAGFPSEAAADVASRSHILGDVQIEQGAVPGPVVQVKVITCPRVESTTAPCVARDGHAAAAFEGSCISCEHRPADLLRDLVRDHLDLLEKIHGDRALTEAVRLIALLLAKTGGRIEATPADLEDIDGTLHREVRPDGTVVLTLTDVDADLPGAAEGEAGA